MPFRHAGLQRPQYACEFRLGLGVSGLTHIASRRYLHPGHRCCKRLLRVLHMGKPAIESVRGFAGVTLLQRNTLYSGRCILYKRRDSRREIPFPLPANYVKLPWGKINCRSRLVGDSLPQSLYWPTSRPPANVPENACMISEHRARDDPLIQRDPTAVTLRWNHSGSELLLSVRPLRTRQMGTLNTSEVMGGGLRTTVVFL